MTKIMLVEDDKSLREIYSIRLVAEGYNIVSAGDGEEALALAVQEKPDLIVSDVMMPKISGFDMLDILRSTPETSKIKVIMMTALSSDDQRMRGESLGADRYLVKSQVGIEDVINTVHEVLGDKANSNASANLDIASTVAATPAAPAPAPAPEATDEVMSTAPAAPQVIPQAPVAPAPVAPVAPAPAPAPVAPAPAPAPEAPQPAQPNGGERVIQPINDPNAETNREEMQRKMDELLGNMPAEQSRPTPPEEDPNAERVDPNAVQPAYMQQLASDLNRDMQGAAADPDSMAGRMAADLRNDALTQQAQAMPAPAPEAPAAEADPNAQAQ